MPLVLVEGVAILALFKKLNRTADYLIYVDNDEFEGSHGLSEKLDSYEETYKPMERADIILHLNH